MSEIPFFCLDASDPGSAPDGLRFMTAGSPALARRADVCLAAAPGTPAGAPLVTLLHGVFGSHWDWALHGGAHLVLRRLVEQERIRPMILAMPSDGLWGSGSGYVARAGEDAETWIRDEVPALARMLYPGAGESGACIGGLSMGGFGAVRIAGKSPDRYVAAAGTSSVTTLTRLRDIVGGEYPTPPGEDTLAGVLTGAASLSIRLDCGTADDLLEDNRALHATLTGAGIDHEYAEFDGGHDWDYWRARLPEILTFFDGALGARGAR